MAFETIGPPTSGGEYVFTDASAKPCHEGIKVGIGGVLYEQFSSQPLQFFAGAPPREVVQLWAETKQQPIGQAELYAVLIAKRTWASVLAQARVVTFVDNVAVKVMLAKRMAREPLHRMILRRTVESDLEASSFNFYFGFQVSPT
eukprot:1349977-Amphidinium_carterae.1